jgi:hypothetical protein
VDGGAGFDTLRVVGLNTNVDLTTLNADARFRAFTNVEAMDFSALGDSVFTLSVGDLLRLTDARNSLRVDGDAGDAVVAGSGWTLAGASGGYTTYTQGNATLVVETEMDRSGIGT